MLRLSEILDERCVLLDIDAKRKKQVIHLLVESIAGTGAIGDPELVAGLVLDREKQASTGIGHGIAIPHLLMADLARTVMAFARTRQGVRFGAIDGAAVRLIFLLLGPAGSPGDHLQLLSRMSRILQRGENIDALMHAADARQVLNALEREEIE